MRNTALIAESGVVTSRTLSCHVAQASSTSPAQVTACGLYHNPLPGAVSDAGKREQRVAQLLHHLERARVGRAELIEGRVAAP